MTTNPMFSSPLLLGFDYLERALESIARSGGDNYPPYNIVQLDDNSWLISVAVAGFARDHLSVTIEDNTLVITGRRKEPEQTAYVYRGIATRQFRRQFLLAEGMEVIGAELSNGVLNIRLERPQPKPRVREIEIVTREAADQAS